MAIHRAQTLRFGYGSVPQGCRSLAMLVGLLFTRVLLRYQQMSTALDIKLYQGDFLPLRISMLATTDLWFRYQDEPVLKG